MSVWRSLRKTSSSLRESFKMKVSYRMLMGLVLKLFQISGFYPFKIDLKLIAQRQFNPNAIRIWSLIFMAFSFIHVIFAIIYEKEIFASKPNDFVGRLTDILKYGVASLCMTVVLIESLATVKLHKQLHGQIHNYRRLLLRSGGNYEKHERHFIWIYLLKFSAVCVLVAYAEYTKVFDFIICKQWLIYWAFNMTPTTICHMRDLQTVLYIDYLKLNMGLVVRELQEISSTSQQVEDYQDSEVLIRELKNLKQKYGQLWMMAMDINSTFGLSQAFIFLYHFIWISCTLYWVSSNFCAYHPLIMALINRL